MNIGIDGNEANLPQRVGVGQFAYHILTELHRSSTSHRFFIYLKSKPLPDLPPENKNWHYIVFGPQKLWTKIALPIHLFLFSPKVDIFYSLSHYSPQFSPIPTIPTIHDLGYLDSPHQFTKKDFYQLKNWTIDSIKHAQKIVAVSEFTKKELSRIYQVNPNKIYVVNNGIGQFTPPDHKTLVKFNIIKPYFLYLGTLKPNKNIPFLIEAFSQIENKQFQLVIAGKKGWLFDDIFSQVKKLNLESKIIFTDFISEAEKSQLYQNCIATVLPSLYEGFGIPAIEAQQSSSPIIASHIPAYQEILNNNSAIFIDPHDTSTLTKALIKVQKPSIRQTLIENGLKNCQKYTWHNSAESLLKVFDAI